MKRYLRIFIYLLLSLALAFSMSSCGTDKEEPVPTQTEEPSDQPGEDPGNEPGEDPGVDPGNEPGDDPGDEPGDEPGDQPGDEPDELIVFADADVKADLVAAFDTDEDGELSEKEAAGVGYDALKAFAWTDPAAVDSFDEFQYFTGLVTEIVYNGVNDIRVPAIFTDCVNMTSVTLPANITTMDSKAFMNCSSLESIVLPEGLRAIFGSTFEATGLKEITIPDALTSFSSGAFRNCASLQRVIFGDAPQLKTIAAAAFKDCTEMTSFYLTADNLVETIGKEAFSGNKLMVLRSINLKNLKSLGESAFNGCAKLKASLVINNPELTEIPSKAFNGCTALASISLSPGLKSIGTYAFSGCRNLQLEEDSLPEGLESIGDRAFRYCAALKHVVLPSSLKEISVRAFESSSSYQIDMETLVVKAQTPPTVTGSNSYTIFLNTEKVPEILVPAESIDDYKSAEGWSVFADKLGILTEAGNFTNRFGMKFTVTSDGRHIISDRLLDLLGGDEPEGLWVPYKSVPAFDAGLVSDVPAETVIYKHWGDREVKIVITRAVGASTPSPVVFIFHGGGWRTGTADSMVSRGKYLSKYAGVASVSVQYSMAGESDVVSIEDTMQDCYDAVDYIRKHASEYNIDPSRMGFAGSSAGGHLAAMMAMTAPEAKVLVSWSGVYEMPTHLGYWSGGTNKTVLAYMFEGDADKLRPYSPQYIVPDGGKVAAILFYGSCDESVHRSQAPAFTEALRAKGHTVQPEYYMYYTHSLCGSSDKGAECWQKSVDFIKANI